jgi:hypothetical protein
MEARKKLIPYSVYLPPEYYAKIKAAAKDRKASGIVRDAIVLMLDGGDAFKSGYNKAIKDASQVVYDCKEAQMVAINGRDMGAVLTSQIELLKMP